MNDKRFQDEVVSRSALMIQDPEAAGRRSAATISLFAVILCAIQYGCTTGGGIHPMSSSLNGWRSPSIGMEFVLVPAGTFKMGSPASEPERDKNETQHQVTLTRRFYMGTCEVTQGEFAEVMGFNPSTVKGSARLPVETVTWFDTISFCNQLSKKEGLPAFYDISNIRMDAEHIVSADVVQKLLSKGYRLPTEAEWEFACRAGTITPFSFGETIRSDQANFDGLTPYNRAAKDQFRDRPIEVAALPPNRFGLYQMAGNVFEWCWDYYDQYPTEPQTNPAGPDHGTERVRRGGAYKSPAGHMRSALRHGIPPSFPFFHQGFRVARTAS